MIKRLAIIGFFALGTALGSSAASAAPAPAGLAGLSQAKTSGIELVQHRRGHYRHRHFRRGYGTRHYAATAPAITGTATIAAGIATATAPTTGVRAAA